MIFRKTQVDDLQEVMQIIDDSKIYFKKNDIPQWQEGKPNQDTLINDIEQGYAYLVEEDGEILGIISICFNTEATYELIEQGRWLNQYEYVTIHRIAVKIGSKQQGIGGRLMMFAQEIALEHNINNIRIDTHRLNTNMQRLIARNNYVYCGVVYVGGSDPERLAYQKVLKD